MATGTRSLPTDSPIPNFQLNERGYLSEGSQEGVYATPNIEPPAHPSLQGATEFPLENPETDRVSTFTGIDDYDTLFAAKYGRGALDPIPLVDNQMVTTPLSVPTPKAGPILSHPKEHAMSPQDRAEKDGTQVPQPSSAIIGEGAAVFTDMTETILDTLDRQVKSSTNTHLDKESLPQEKQKEMISDRNPQVLTQTEVYPDLFLPVRENYRISDRFRGYLDHMSADNNPMVLVELHNLSVRYGTSIYAVDRINGTMYGKFSIGYRMIPERVTILPQYQPTSLEMEYPRTYENTLPGITNIATPLAQSTPVTQASHIPVVWPTAGRDIVQPIASKEARAKYLEERMKGMSNVKQPMISSSLEEKSLPSTDLTRQIDLFCREQKEKRKTEKEAHKMILDAFDKTKSKQSIPPRIEERERVYSQMAQDMEKTREVVRRTMSQASTISVEERQMTLTEREFRMIKRKMDKIDARLNEMYQNWHAEYGSATSIEECEEIKNFYKPYMDKYESKFRILYQLLQQPRSVPTHDDTSGITPSLVALDDATSLKQRSKQRGEVPKQYTTIEGRLTPHTPRSEDMRLEHSLSVTPEGLLDTIPAVAQRETLDITSETTYREIPCTQVEPIPGEVTVPKTTQGTKETSRAEVLAST